MLGHYWCCLRWWAVADFKNTSLCRHDGLGQGVKVISGQRQHEGKSHPRRWAHFSTKQHKKQKPECCISFIWRRLNLARDNRSCQQRRRSDRGLEALTKLCAVVPLMEVAADENEASGVIGRLTETLGWMQWHINLSRHRAAKYFRKKAEVGRTLKWSAGVGRCQGSSARGSVTPMILVAIILSTVCFMMCKLNVCK